jgi:fucose 4-O-acetylase-like acetyltransferase
VYVYLSIYVCASTGSGTGRPVMAAALLYDFATLTGTSYWFHHLLFIYLLIVLMLIWWLKGIELLKGLTGEAQKVLARYKEKFKDRKENAGYYPFV